MGAPAPAEDGAPVDVGVGAEGDEVRGGVGDGDGGVGGGGGGDGVPGGVVFGGAVLGGGVVAAPPRTVMTVPPGANAMRLVHCPGGAALVAVAVMT